MNGFRIPLISRRNGHLVFVFAITIALTEPVSAEPSSPDAAPANAAPGVKYVGRDACIECHKAEAESYFNTTHSIAASFCDVKVEPAPGRFLHQPSENTYEVVHKQNGLFHREIRGGIDDTDDNITEQKIDFTVGSGAHAKTYLFRDGDFWSQSPLTWYRDTESWGMSPGYDRPGHLSFTRNTRTGCVFCHVGSIDSREGNPYVFEVIEEAIGCERCHGPGELHVNQYRKLQADGEKDSLVDPLIVNPHDLSRELSEAICQQCHLQGSSFVTVRGKEVWDYRPGLPLTQTRVDYQFRDKKAEMKIVGHVEQMHMSECYKKTDSLTCVTCHDPHHAGKIDDPVVHYRSICMSCHDDACTKPHAERLQINDNDCSDCHMPKMKTNVPHAAFRHHQIGIHDGDHSGSIRKGFFAVVEPAGLDPTEKQRCEALGKLTLYRLESSNELHRELGLEGLGDLVRLRESGYEDSELDSALAAMAFEQQQFQIAGMLSKSVVKSEKAPSQSKVDAMQVLADISFKQNQVREALNYFKNLTEYRRDARGLYFLALCQNNLGQVDAAIETLKRSLDVEPSQDAAHVALQAIYHARGSLKASKHHGTLALAYHEKLARLRKKEK